MNVRPSIVQNGSPVNKALTKALTKKSQCENLNAMAFARKESFFSSFTKYVHLRFDRGILSLVSHSCFTFSSCK